VERHFWQRLCPVSLPLSQTFELAVADDELEVSLIMDLVLQTTMNLSYD
jgi:hypothetical protein